MNLLLGGQVYLDQVYGWWQSIILWASLWQPTGSQCDGIPRWLISPSDQTTATIWNLFSSINQQRNQH